MGRYILVIFFILNFSSRIEANGQVMKSGKYMFNAPALYVYGSSKNRGVQNTTLFVDIQYEKNDIYELRILNGGSDFLKFQISNSGKMEIIEHRVLSDTVKGTGILNNNGTAKGQLTVVSTNWGYFWERTTSEWFLRPATQVEIDKKLLRGLRTVNRCVSQFGLSQTKKNILENLNSGFPYHFAADISHIKQMLESGQIEYKDGNFKIYREKLAHSFTPIKPDISMEFYKEEISFEEAKRELNIKDSPNTPNQKAIHAQPAKQKPTVSPSSASNSEKQLKAEVSKLGEKKKQFTQGMFVVLCLIFFGIVTIARYLQHRKNNR